MHISWNLVNDTLIPVILFQAMEEDAVKDTQSEDQVNEVVSLSL